MRIILLSALSLLLSYSTTLGQGFAPIGAEWIYTNEYCFFPHPTCGYVKITVVSDTIFDGQTYSVLEKKYSDPSYSYLDSTAYVTSVGDSVFTYDPYAATSNLLYDFSRAVGDTSVIMAPESGNTFSPSKGEMVSYFRVVVDSTAEIVVDGVPLRVQYTSPTDTSELQFLFRTIERIGNVNSLFGISSTMLTAGYYGSLACYSELGGFHYGQPIETCGLISGIEQHEQVETVTVYPNPATDVVRFRVLDPSASRKSGTGSSSVGMTLRVLDAVGREVKALLILPERDENGSIDVSTLPQGIYFLELTDGQGRKTVRKFVKG